MEQVVNETNKATEEQVDKLSDFKYAEKLLPVLDWYQGLYKHTDHTTCKTIFESWRILLLQQAYKCLYTFVREVLGLNMIRHIANVQKEFDALMDVLDKALKLQLEFETEVLILNSEDGRLLEALIETPEFQLESFEQAAQFIQPMYEFIRYITVQTQGEAVC